MNNDIKKALSYLLEPVFKEKVSEYLKAKVGTPEHNRLQDEIDEIGALIRKLRGIK